ncbi:MAG: exported protein of unknown function [Candidatus Saccharibacteria bacterium]|nr:exported protein of unknown function [Candidatus Saccharibacteria bacterium]
MWCHLPTVIRRSLVLLILVLTTLTVAFTTTLIFAHASHAVAGTTKTINFQGRLLTAGGAVVPDGNYNIQFKIYQGGSGAAAGNPDGTLKWTETYVNGSSTGVEVKDGFLSVNLGSKNPFGTSVDWNQDNLWLSMNIAGSAAGCSTFGTSPCGADGEMLPMKQITATPYAINSGQLNGITSDGFLQNTTTPQTADFNITGAGTADLLQATTKLATAAIDTVSANGTLTIGAAYANTINIGRADDANSTINIGVGSGSRTVTVGTTDSNSYVNVQGGTQGVRVNTNGGFAVHTITSNTDNLLVDSYGNTTVKLSTDARFEIHGSSNNTLLSVVDNNQIITAYNSSLIANGSAQFNQGITIQGTGTYLTPGGASLSTAINIPNYTVPAYGSVVSFGLPSTSAATARGLLVADGRTSSHQATIGVLSPDENAIMGLSWNGSNSTGTLSNTASSLALQGNGLNLLTATNNSGQSNVGIGNSASAGYALDVTGDINSSTQYRIGGVTALTGSSLTFAGTTSSTVTSATSQSLDLNGMAGVNIKNNGTTSASFGASNVQIGSGSGTGTPTLLTLDKSGSAPSVSGDAMLGSMYYDTTLGQVQCFEANGWGNCTNSPDDFVSLSPEYSNAVIHSTGTGTMTSDLCSDALNINDGSSSQPTICGTNETYNYYNWTSSQVTAQTRSIYVTYQLPSSFKEFVAGSTSLTGRTDSSDSTVSYQVYRNTTTGLVACGSVTSASTGTQTSWQKATATSTADPSTCSFAAGDSIVFKINLTAANDANAYASTLNFAFSNH